MICCSVLHLCKTERPPITASRYDPRASCRCLLSTSAPPSRSAAPIVGTRSNGHATSGYRCSNATDAGPSPISRRFRVGPSVPPKQSTPCNLTIRVANQQPRMPARETPFHRSRTSVVATAPPIPPVKARLERQPIHSGKPSAKTSPDRTSLSCRLHTPANRRGRRRRPAL